MWRRLSVGKVGIASLQGTYFLATGIWPLVSRRTFERVTGPKVQKKTGQPREQVEQRVQKVMQKG
jgi:hypothetical protein